MQALVGDSRSGKTTALMSWILGGEVRSGYPSWSRVLIVQNVGKSRALVVDYPNVNAELRGLGGPALAKLILAYDRDRYAIQRLRLRDVEVAIDDAHEWLYAQIGFMPALVALTGAPYERKSLG